MSAPPIELVVYDCDGVLIDSERLLVGIEARLLTELGWPLTERDVVERFLGRSDAYMQAEIEKQLGRPLGTPWPTMYEREFDSAVQQRLTPVEGVVEALGRITVRGCVASSSTHPRLRRTLGHTGLYERFAGRVFSASDVARGKPEPDLFLHAAAAMGVAPQACVVVEDSRFGVAAARAAGMRALGYAGGLTPASWLEGPDTVVFDDMRALPELIAAL